MHFISVCSIMITNTMIVVSVCLQPVAEAAAQLECVCVCLYD